MTTHGENTPQSTATDTSATATPVARAQTGISTTILRGVGSLVAAIVGGAIGHIVAATYAGNYAVDFTFADHRGYEAAAVVGLIVGSTLGAVASRPSWWMVGLAVGAVSFILVPIFGAESAGWLSLAPAIAMAIVGMRRSAGTQLPSV